MGTQYSHISLAERAVIQALKRTGKKEREIGRFLGRDHRTIGRELARNRSAGEEYDAEKAEARAQARQCDQRRRAPLKNHEIFLFVRKLLKEMNWSPEIIAASVSRNLPGESITAETIYAYIYGKGRKYRLWEHLPRKQKKRRKKGGRNVHGEKKVSRIPGAVSIEELSRKANTRNQAGHWETDLMEGPRGSGGALMVCIERTTRYAMLTLVTDKKAETVQKALQKRLKKVQSFQTSRKPIVRSITSDNGSENVMHREVAEELNAKWYFCHPYHSWEKGSVENMIGRIRRYIPKGTSLSKYTPEQIQWLEDVVNNTPRECIGWRTPNEAIAEVLNSYKFTPPTLHKWGTST